MQADRPKILIVYGYHPEETFAVNVGESFLRDNADPDIKVVEYTGSLDQKTSNRNLRLFVRKFEPIISPIILHSDDHLGTDALIIHCAQSKQKKKELLRPLFDFAFICKNNNLLVIFDIFLVPNTLSGLIEIELDPKMGSGKAMNLLRDFSQYLLDLSERGIIL